jgi:hypothetical protein
VVLLAGCSAGTPGEGTFVAQVNNNGAPINVSVDGSDVYVVLMDQTAASPRVAVVRVQGTQVAKMPLGATDWSDYTKSQIVDINPTQTARVSGGRAFFLGYAGITIVSLDGSPGQVLYPPPDPGDPPGPPLDYLGAFTVDGGDVYVCGNVPSRDLSTGTRLWRIRPQGTWERLFAWSGSDACFGSAIAVDADSVYWSTQNTLRAWDRTTGQTRTVVEGGLGQSVGVPELAVSRDSLIWLDESGVHAARKTATPSTSTDALLSPFKPTDPVVFSLVTSPDHIYWMNQIMLFGMPLAGGSVDVLAQRPLPPGSFVGLALRGATLYFGEAMGAPGRVLLRSVP